MYFLNPVLPLVYRSSKYSSLNVTNMLIIVSGANIKKNEIRKLSNLFFRIEELKHDSAPCSQTKALSFLSRNKRAFLSHPFSFSLPTGEGRGGAFILQPAQGVRSDRGNGCRCSSCRRSTNRRSAGSSRRTGCPSRAYATSICRTNLRC